MICFQAVRCSGHCYIPRSANSGNIFAACSGRVGNMDLWAGDFTCGKTWLLYWPRDWYQSRTGMIFVFPLWLETCADLYTVPKKRMTFLEAIMGCALHTKMTIIVGLVGLHSWQRVIFGIGQHHRNHQIHLMNILVIYPSAIKQGVLQILRTP